LLSQERPALKTPLSLSFPEQQVKLMVIVLRAWMAAKLWDTADSKAY